MPKSQNQSRVQAVVVLSGGMDSTVCAALAVREHGADGVAALHVDYGQRTEKREREAFERICDRLGIARRLTVRNEALSDIGGSALTDEELEVPEAGSEIGHTVPITYVPFRNAHFLSVAVSWAEVLGAEKIYIGAVAQDSSGYPDCRPEYYRAFNEVIRTGTKDGSIEIVTPLIGLRKAEIVQLGLELAAPFDLTWSCYSREDSACGVCESCALRLRAFEAAGTVDPISYLPQAARK
ncbi:MAG TPA: 7-cyano-7-deazaguanine synthase QueC [Terriglobales bacterium]|nr:7-cyano-7-deazaguanine synthase QueC [Terriglobales bacterium]